MELKNKNILVLGAKGMLGNAIFSYLGKNSNLNIIGTSSKEESGYLKFFIGENYLIDIEKIFKLNNFDYIINCIGIIRPDTSNIDDYKKSLIINSHFPKILQFLSYKYNFKLIHFSTDCVFNGKKGNYSINEIPNELGIYGLSKYLGEINDFNNLTIRTSIIGIEKGNNSKNLLNWFLSNTQSSIYGYKNVLWNGLTTLTLSKIIEKIIIENISISGLHQFCGESISKYELLILFNDIFGKNINIIPEFDNKSNKIIIKSSKQTLFDSIILPIKEQLLELKLFYNL